MLPKKKFFDSNHKKIDTKLHAVQLASFMPRCSAYALDIGLYYLVINTLWLLIPLLLLFLGGSRRARRKLSQASKSIRKNVTYLEQRLAHYNIAAPLRTRFIKTLRLYLQLFIIIPFGLFSLLLILIVWGIAEPGAYFELRQTVSPAFKSLLPILDLTNVVYLMTKFFGVILYFGFFTWYWQGQTPGKRLLRIRVVKLNGRKITLWDAIQRSGGYTTSAALLLLGFFKYFLDKNHQTTHDKIAETVVIVKPN